MVFFVVILNISENNSMIFIACPDSIASGGHDISVVRMCLPVNSTMALC